MRILITGSRDWDDRDFIYRTLNELCEEFDLNHDPDEYGNTMPDASKVTIVHGACPKGADLWADEWCLDSFFTAERYPADWNTHGKRAGFVRNAEMVALGADLCLAFIVNNSKGATMTANLAEKAGILVRLYER